MGSDKPKDKEPYSNIGMDLERERETFVKTFLKKGVEFTEDLIRENQRIRRELAHTQAENARLRAQIASEDAIRELLSTIEVLEKEREELLERSLELERTSERFEDRYLQIENELNDLANLYIASFQLHCTLSLPRVVHNIFDLLYQFVGASASVVYIIEPERKFAVPLMWLGIDGTYVEPEKLGEGRVGEVCLTGIIYINDEEKKKGTLKEPLAVIPLMADGQPVGVISVIELLQQKEKWAPVDTELFKLLAANACTALIAANLYNKNEGPVVALKGVMEKLDHDDAQTRQSFTASEASR